MYVQRACNTTPRSRELWPRRVQPKHAETATVIVAAGLGNAEGVGGGGFCGWRCGCAGVGHAAWEAAGAESSAD